MKTVLSDYEKSINALIPLAASEADAKVVALGKKTTLREGADGERFRWSFWSQFFHTAMNQMAYDAGLRSKF
jgi:hypothetical protein